MSIACVMFGLWCATQTHLEFSGSFIGQRVLDDMTKQVNFIWEMPCLAKSANVNYSPYMRAVAEMLNPMQDKLPSFLHGMAPNFVVSGNTIMRFSSPAPCAYNLNGDITVTDILDFRAVAGTVDVRDASITLTK